MHGGQTAGHFFKNSGLPGKSLKADFQSSHEAPRSSLRVLASN